jgi:hypothetical protein
MLAEKFIESHGLSMVATALTPEVTDGRLTHRWECRINSGDGVAGVFAYQMGDGHREQQTFTRSGSLWARYTGPLPTKYHEDGTPKFWPKGTVVADEDRWKKSRCRTPELPEVLECLAMDARSIAEEYGMPDVREWAKEFGYESEFLAMDIFNGIQANNRRLRKFLSRAEFAEFLTIEEV